jgi:hypothetical protein
VQAHQFDQPADVGLRSAEPQDPVLRAQAPREDGQVDHQRRVGEAKVRQVDDDVARRLQRRGERTTTTPARDAVLIPRDPQDRKLFVKADDLGNLVQTSWSVQAAD